MIHFRKIAIAAIGFAAISKAMVSSPENFHYKLVCRNAKTNTAFAMIYEDQPYARLATVVSANGSKLTMQFSQKVESSSGGCYVSEKVTKVFFHPYYDIKVSGVYTYGRDGTRCAGIERPAIFTGFFSGQMQKPVELVCKAEL